MVEEKSTRQIIRSKLDSLDDEITADNPNFNPKEHDSKSRLKITKLFLRWYFWLIVFGFLFSGLYNFVASFINMRLSDKQLEIIPYLDVSNTVSIVTTTLSSGVGFVIGYYFKAKESD